MAILNVSLNIGSVISGIEYTIFSNLPDSVKPVEVTNISSALQNYSTGRAYISADGAIRVFNTNTTSSNVLHLCGSYITI